MSERPATASFTWDYDLERWFAMVETPDGRATPTGSGGVLSLSDAVREVERWCRPRGLVLRGYFEIGVYRGD